MVGGLLDCQFLTLLMTPFIYIYMERMSEVGATKDEGDTTSTTRPDHAGHRGASERAAPLDHVE